MREIKFRAWCKTTRYMWDWERIKNELKMVEFNTNESTWDFQQYTGLKDKNGTPIYEGDICRIDTKGAFPPYGHRDDSEAMADIAILAVEWWNGQFVFNANRYEYLDNGGDDYINFGWWVRSNNHNTSLKQIEVIGSIHENPELLAPRKE